MTRRAVLVAAVHTVSLILCCLEVTMHAKSYHAYRVISRLEVSVRDPEILDPPYLVACFPADPRWQAGNVTHEDVMGLYQVYQRSSSFFMVSSMDAAGIREAGFFLGFLSHERQRCTAFRFLKPVPRVMVHSELLTFVFHRMTNEVGVARFFLSPASATHLDMDSRSAVVTRPLQVSPGDERMRNVTSVVSRYPVLTYQRRVSLLLPPPFESGCREYRSMKSRSNCRNYCIKDLSIRALGAVPGHPTLLLLRRWSADSDEAAAATDGDRAAADGGTRLLPLLLSPGGLRLGTLAAAQHATAVLT